MGHQDLIAKGVEWLQDYRHRKLVETVKYVQDGVLYEDLHMTVAHDSATSDDDTGVIFTSRQQDFLANPTEFTAIGLEEPLRGDHIIRTVAAEEIEYEVVGFGNEPPYRFMSRYRKAWRIHAQIIKVETIT